MSPANIERYACLAIAAVLAVVAVQPWAKGAELALAGIAGILTGKETLASAHDRREKAARNTVPPPAE